MQLGVLSAAWAGQNRRAGHSAAGGFLVWHSVYQQSVSHLSVTGAGRFLIWYGFRGIYVAERGQHLFR
ncbi:hypothetical protein D3C76_1403010 [compost metagenome]